MKGVQMRLLTFRVCGCFGFHDSGTIDMDPPGGLVSFLGRNSSGKTSLLQALRHFESELVPRSYKNFENFNPPSGPSILTGQFAGNLDNLDLNSFLEAVKRYLVRSGVPKKALEDHARSLALLENIENEYGNLFEVLARAGEAYVNKGPAGAYSFHRRLGETESASKRLRTVAGLLSNAYPQGNFQYDNKQIPVKANRSEIENAVFLQFPRIVFFGEAYSLDDDLPDRISQDELGPPGEDLTSVFISFLGEEELRRFLVANDPDERGAILGGLQGKVDRLCAKINRSPVKGKTTPLLEITLHEKNGLQLTAKADRKKSFYRHLSDNTKLLFAYHLRLHADSPRGNILLFDEPNVGFHPSAQRFLLDFLSETASSGNQVFVSTHSEYMIDLDRLSGVRLMAADKHDMPKVLNHPYRRARRKGDFLALQPIRDAIGLEYGSSLNVEGSAILTEGVTDLIYLRALNQQLKVCDTLPLAPARSDAHILTIIPFFVSQGIGLRIVIDSGNIGQKIEEEFGFPAEYIFEVPVPAEYSTRFNRSGIEDLFSKEDFLELAGRAGLAIEAKRFAKVPNSHYMKNHPAKRMLAQETAVDLREGEVSLSEETVRNFRRVLEFCSQESWFRV